MRNRVAAAAWLVLLVAPVVVLAQTGPQLLIKPLLSEDETWESRGDALFFKDGETSGGVAGDAADAGADSDFRMSMFEWAGRFREQRERLIPRVGWDVTYLDLNSDALDALDQAVADVSLAAGLELGRYFDWRAGLTVGVGYAGNAPFGETDAWYGKATLLLGRKLDEKTDLALVVDYDGNRSVFPDLPLPGFAYRREFDPKLSYVIGIPVSSVTWRPTDGFRIDVTWTMIESFDARVERRLSPHWLVYGGLEYRSEAFSIDDLEGEHDRLLFQQRRAELGIEWQPSEDTRLILAGGYAFKTEFSAGFDQRESELIADVSDEPYLRFGIERRF